jgi:DNA modification methylase
MTTDADAGLLHRVVPQPYYERGGVTIYHGDCREILPTLPGFDLMMTDPPYGISYQSGMESETLARSILGDESTELRDFALEWHGGAAVVFGTWKTDKPKGIKALLIWDTLGALGMGDLRIPWKPSHQEIYILGSGFTGKRTSDVIQHPPVQSMAKTGRVHPHEKPVGLLRHLLGKSPSGRVIDPFMGSGSALVACKAEGRQAVGIEIEERYCEIAAKRLSQGVLF